MDHQRRNSRSPSRSPSPFYIPVPIRTSCTTVKDLIRNIKAASEAVDENAVFPLIVLNSQNQMEIMRPSRVVHIEGAGSYYFKTTRNNWIYLYDCDHYDTFDGVQLGYGNHYTIGYSDAHPDLVKFHCTRYVMNSTSHELERMSSYCEFKLQDFAVDMNPPCHRELPATNKLVPTHKKLDYILNSEFDIDRSYIKTFFAYGLVYNRTSSPKPSEKSPQPAPTSPPVSKRAKSATDRIIFNEDGKTYAVETGARGGRYIMVDGIMHRINAGSVHRFTEL